MKSTSTTARAIPATLGPVLTRSMAMSAPVSLAIQVSSVCTQGGCRLKRVASLDSVSITFSVRKEILAY